MAMQRDSKLIELSQIIKRFKAGEFNVLVSTSIGEEGLDIGEIDMIACYDAQKTPIRMVCMTSFARVSRPDQSL